MLSLVESIFSFHRPLIEEFGSSVAFRGCLASFVRSRVFFYRITLI